MSWLLFRSIIPVNFGASNIFLLSVGKVTIAQNLENILYLLHLHFKSQPPSPKSYKSNDMKSVHKLKSFFYAFHSKIILYVTRELKFRK